MRCGDDIGLDRATYYRRAARDRCRVPLALGSSDTLDPTALSAEASRPPEAGPNAFSIPIATLDRDQAEAFAKGKEQFNEAWVVAPQAGGVWGLGPTFNEDRCAHCHANNGRATAPDNGQEAELGMLVRLSIPGDTPQGGPNPHPAYGDQLQNRGIPDRVPAEGRAIFTYTAREVIFADGEKVTLRVPSIEFKDLQFGELGRDTMISPRIAPAVVGMGLLEAVPEEAILALAKEEEKAGVGGKPNYVWDYEADAVVLGRFGWKANQPSLRQQTAAAFLGDIGATTYMFPEENCPAVQHQCLDVPSASKCGGQGGCTGNAFRPEVIPSRLNNITLYLQVLAVPARRNVNDPEVKRGEQLFGQSQCSSVPRTRAQDGSEDRDTGRGQPGDSPLHRSAPARHGRGAGRRPSRLQSERTRMAHASAVGNRLTAHGERPKRPSPRWTRP